MNYTEVFEKIDVKITLKKAIAGKKYIGLNIDERLYPQLFSEISGLLVNYLIKISDYAIKEIDEKLKQKNKYLLIQNKLITWPKSHAVFEQQLKDQYGLTISDFRNKGVYTGYGWKYQGLYLHYFAENPYWHLSMDEEVQNG